MENNVSNKNIAIFDYLKAIAIIFVIIHHYTFEHNILYSVFLLYIIYMAVPIFLFVTGFVYTKSYLRQNIEFNNLYGTTTILRRLLRVSLPFALIFIIEYFFNLKGLKESNNLLYDFYQGGIAIGKGSYYYPIIIQIILIFPIIYAIIKKFNHLGFIILLLIEYIYSFICYYIALPISEYRLQAFRYLTLLSSGTWLALNPEFIIKKKYLILSFIIGALYIYVSGYINIPSQPYDYPYWKNSSGIFITLYIFPILYLLYMNFKDCKTNNIIGKIFKNIGKASWHIYLIQMLYYITFYKYFKTEMHWINILLNLIICLTAGFLFYYLDKKFTDNLKKFFIKNK